MGYNRLTDGGIFSASEQNQNLTDIETLSQYAQGYCVLSGLTLSAGTGLSVNVAAGKAVIKKLVETDAAVVAGLPPSSTTYIWLRDDGMFTQTADLDPPGGAHALLGSVTTGASGVAGTDNSIAWKGLRVEDGTKLVAGPSSLTTYLDAPRLGVGTDSPADELHVSGIARADAVSLPQRASAPGPAADRGFLYTKADGGDTELFYQDENGNEVQLTQDGEVLLSGYLPLAGGTMTGGIDMDDNTLTGLAPGSESGDAATYEQLVNHSIRTFVLHAMSSTQLQGTTRYYPLNGYRGPSAGGEDKAQTKMYDQSFTFKNLRVYVSANTAESASTLALRDDGQDSALTVTIPAGQAGAFENTASSAQVAAGSLCDYALSVGSGGVGSLVVETMQVDAVSAG